MALHLWAKLRSKTRLKMLKAMQGRAMFWVTKRYKKEIGVLAAQLNIPGKRLNEHFERLRFEGVRARELGDRMIQELTEVRELAAEISVSPGKINQVLRYKTIEQILQEMREYANQQRQMQAKVAA